MPGAVVYGYGELITAFGRAGREAKLGVQRTMREIAEPVRRSAEGLALEKVRRMPLSPAWGKMRVGQTPRLVYVVPVKRGVKGRGDDPKRRPNLAVLMNERALEPALIQHEPEILHALERALNEITAEFNAGGAH